MEEWKGQENRTGRAEERVAVDLQNRLSAEVQAGDQSREESRAAISNLLLSSPQRVDGCEGGFSVVAVGGLA